MGPPFTDDASTYFESANRSKKSVALDLRDPEDQALARELAARADVVVENFKAGAMTSFGLDHAAVRQVNPRVVYCSISGFGADSDLPGYDFLVQAVGGLMSITGAPDGPPTKVGVALVDVLTAKDATIGVLAALAARDRDGEGQLVEVNLLSSLLGSLANQASAYLWTGKAPGRLGNQHPSIAPYETLSCEDGLLAVCCGNDGQFRRCVTELGAPALATDPRFATNADRVAHRAELVAALEVLLATDTTDSWIARLTAVGVPSGKVGDLADAFGLADSLGLDPTAAVGPGRAAQVRHPVRYSRTPVTQYAPPPRLGEHSDEIRRWLSSKEH